MDPMTMMALAGGGGGGGGGPLGGGATSSAETGPISSTNTINMGGFAIPAVPQIPGTFANSAFSLQTAAGGVGVSNNALIIGGLALVAVLLLLKKRGRL